MHDSLVNSGVTKVGVTRGGNWRCHLFFLKKTDDLVFAHRLCVVSSQLPRFVTTPTTPSYIVCPVCLSKFSHKNLMSFGCHPVYGVTRGGPPAPPLLINKLIMIWRPWCWRSNSCLSATMAETSISRVCRRSFTCIFFSNISGGCISCIPYADAFAIFSQRCEQKMRFFAILAPSFSSIVKFNHLKFWRPQITVY